MIIVFLIVLAIALVLANILITAAYPKKNEKGFVEPFNNNNNNTNEVFQPEVIDNITQIKENNMIIQGSLQATNKKVEMINERLATLEKVIITMVEKKIGEKN
jgi:hypothetical protein